jgi:glutamate 5-kinase
MNSLVSVLADLRNMGHEVLLVSSGAVGVGLGKLGRSERPSEIQALQAAAAIGQSELMFLYDKLFGEYGLTVAQLLLTKFVLMEDRKRNVQNALTRLIQSRVIPVVNENDTVAIDELELEMGENDSLAANVAVISGAELLIIMSDIDGLFDKDPRKNDDAQLIPVVQEITDDIVASAGGAGTAFGSGGMATKIKAAKIANDAGIDLVIINGRHPDNLYGVFENKPVGTVFQAAATLA